MDEIRIDKDLNERIKRLIKKDYDGVLPPGSHDNIITNLLSNERARHKIEEFEKDTRTRLENIQILEVGSGLGVQTTAFQEKGNFAVGLEADKDSSETARSLCPGSLFVRGVGEFLPFSSDVFDVVVSYQVLEHVVSPQEVLREMTRVLRPGGILYVVVPNYRSFWEGHYGLPWSPLFCKTLAKIYVSCLGRQSNFIDSLHWVTPRQMRRWTRDLPLECDWRGSSKWIERFRDLELPPLGLGAWIAPLLSFLKFLHLNILFARTTAWLGWFYPIVLAAKKPRKPFDVR